jgi:transglutaminase-like putative cysteine protease
MKGTTGVTTNAEQAWSQRQGVCQDLAHLAIGALRCSGIPARYVSGYIDPEDSGHAASHAWVDAWAGDPGYDGWISIDVTHARLMTDAYCRIAVGRDYEAAAPVRGVRHGGGDEALEVDVCIVPQ